MRLDARAVRKADLAKIHLAQKQLGLDEATYRDMLEAVVGVRSSVSLDARDRGKVLAHLRQRGAEFRRKRRPRPAPEKRPLLGKIYALLGSRPAAYAEGILKQMFGQFAPDRLEWATPQQLHKVVAALIYDQQRRRRGTAT